MPNTDLDSIKSNRTGWFKLFYNNIRTGCAYVDAMSSIRWPSRLIKSKCEKRSMKICEKPNAALVYEELEIHECERKEQTNLVSFENSDRSSMKNICVKLHTSEPEWPKTFQSIALIDFLNWTNWHGTMLKAANKTDFF